MIAENAGNDCMGGDETVGNKQFREMFLPMHLYRNI